MVPVALSRHLDYMPPYLSRLTRAPVCQPAYHILVLQVFVETKSGLNGLHGLNESRKDEHFIDFELCWAFQSRGSCLWAESDQMRKIPSRFWSVSSVFSKRFHQLASS
ncbi:hypothetical protein Tco_0200536 [Tanacetum coccineum]